MFDQAAYARAKYAVDKVAACAAIKTRQAKVGLKVRAYILGYLLAHPCLDCGESDPVVLEFDHRPSEVKRFNLAKAVRKNFSLASVEAEIAKCDVRCANCHIRVTYKRAGRTHRDIVVAG